MGHDACDAIRLVVRARTIAGRASCPRRLSAPPARDTWHRNPHSSTSKYFRVHLFYLPETWTACLRINLLTQGKNDNIDFKIRNEKSIFDAFFIRLWL